MQQLVIEVQEQQTDSSHRKKALYILFKEIYQAPTLWRARNHYPDWSDFYEEHYREALQQVMLEFFKGINRYNPQKPVMAWINETLKYRFKDILDKDFSKGITSKAKKSVQIISLDRLDTFISERLISGKDKISDEELLRKYLEEDPDNIFKRKHIKGLPQASFQYIAIARLDGQGWKQISKELGGVKISTLSSFYERSLKGFIPFLQDKLKS
ncbi:sigma-70 RNA polymerase sigma factor region 4 domain-containing protein [Scytonema sp. NUACC21]